MATGYEKPLVAIVGPTASGKTTLAVKLAEQYGGEIICADSRTIYKYLDVGTAKPTRQEQARVPHHLLDVVAPNESFTVADFQSLARDAIRDIRLRGRVPFLVGGSGLYVDALLFDFDLGKPVDQRLRDKLNTMTIEELQYYCFINNIVMPENDKNKRYLVRAIEQNGVNNRSKQQPISNSIIVGITTNRDELRHRINKREQAIFDNAVVEEATNVARHYGWESEAMKGNVYPIIHEFIEEKITYEQMIEKAKTVDWRLAKRQLTWFKRNQYINWLELHRAQKYLESYLSTVKTC